MLFRSSCPVLLPDLDTFRDDLDGRGWTGGQNLTNSNIVNGQATVTGTLEYTTGDVGVTIELQKRNGEWCVNYVETDS